ncbi:MAG TPA: NADH-quinone oxidoreductase subunit J [Candidatus Fraserbacteria bacterium]|nr:NADH-quinone oxidoreductase subunit J [Candidatus Fraserbacteria bacterium]
MIWFIILAIGTLGSALMVVRTHKLAYAALWLAGSLVGVAGLFLTLSAAYLATVQVLVYAGAVVTLILFAIMFTHAPADEQGATAELPRPAALGRLALLLLGLAAALAAIVTTVPWQAVPQGQESYGQLAQAIFGPYLLPFELLSLLLLAALVGAVVLARKDQTSKPLKGDRS